MRRMYSSRVYRRCIALEHARRSRLHRQMHVIAQRRILVDRIDDLLHEIARMRRREPHPADAGHLRDAPQQRGEIQSRLPTDRDSC